MSDPGTRIKVLSVVGAGRSGTTVLASILGEVHGFESVGELRYLWERGVLAERPCGCGHPPGECTVWAPVIAKTVAALDGDDARRTIEDIVDAQHELARARNLPRVLRSTDGSDNDWEALQLVQRATAAACAAFAEVTGSWVLVDTSKRPVDAAVLAGIESLDHYVLHIVRDPRAVVHSWRRVKTFTTAGKTRTMGQLTPMSTVRRWITNSLEAELLRRRIPPSRWLHIRYEDFAVEPRECVDNIVSFLQEGGQTPFVDDHAVVLNPNHIVSGNPNRFTTGTVAISSDDEWQRKMPRGSQRMIGLYTFPLMLRYGYIRGYNDGRKTS